MRHDERWRGCDAESGMQGSRSLAVPSVPSQIGLEIWQEESRLDLDLLMYSQGIELLQRQNTRGTLTFIRVDTPCYNLLVPEPRGLETSFIQTILTHSSSSWWVPDSFEACA